MQQYIENLRSKPRHYKERVLYSIVAGVTFLLFIGWVSGLSMADKNKKTSSSDTSSGPLSMIKESFVNIWDKAKSGGYANTKTENKTTVSETPSTTKEIPFGTQIELGGGDSVLNEGTN